MKLKCLPEDFLVDELTHFALGDGAYAVYRLEKRSLGTPEAIAAIVQRWKIPRQRITYGGLKDKHAVTRQHVTIYHGPRRHLQQQSFQLTYIGQAQRPFSAHDIAGNRFTISMRDMSPDAARRVLEQAAEVGTTGIPNYFDDQRFGSLGMSGEWIAKPWCQSNFERALWLALADTHPDDRGDEKREKQILREHWGRWVECKAALSRSHRRSIITYLADKEAAGKPTDFRGAFARLSIDLRGLYLSAFQSALWNQLLSRFLLSTFPPKRLAEFQLASGASHFVLGLSSDETDMLAGTLLPLPSARQKLEPGLVADLTQQVAAEHALELRELRVKYPRDSFFSKSNRPAFVRVTDLQSELGDDELYEKRKKVSLSFSLPRGSYATIVVKRLCLS